MKSIFALLFAATILLVSCENDDNGTNPSNDTQSEYLPLKEGNKWTYDVYDSDNQGNPEGQIQNTYTLTVGSKSTIEGRTAYRINSDDNEEDQETYMSSTKDGVFLYAPSLGETGIGFSVDIGWIQLYKENAEQWDSYSASVDISVPFKVKAELDSKCYKMEDLTVEINGTTYDAVKFRQITNTSGEIEVDGETESLDGTDTTEYVFAKNIGLYSTYSYGEYDPEFPLPGSVDILKSFELK